MHYFSGEYKGLKYGGHKQNLNTLPTPPIPFPSDLVKLFNSSILGKRILSWCWAGSISAAHKKSSPQIVHKFRLCNKIIWEPYGGDHWAWVFVCVCLWIYTWNIIPCMKRRGYLKEYFLIQWVEWLELYQTNFTTSQIGKLFIGKLAD